MSNSRGMKTNGTYKDEKRLSTFAYNLGQKE